MSDQITEARVVSFRNSVFHLSQQQGSKLLPFVMSEQVVGKRHYFDRIGSTEAALKTGRHVPTPLTESAHSRRAVDLADYHWADAIDHEDRIRMLWDPAGPYQQAAMWSLGRKIDDEIIDAFAGAALTGEAGGSSVALSSDASQVIANGSTGLTVAKLRQAYRVFEENDVNFNELFIVVSPIGVEQLIADVQVTSRDFSNNMVLDSGTMDGKRYMGMKFIVSTRLDVAANIRSCFVFTRDAIQVALGQSPQAFVDRRPDLSQATQVYVRMSCDAVRMEEVRVVQIDIDETA